LIVFALAVLLGLAYADTDQIDQCGQHVSCTDCIAHNPCGWCELNIRYEDGTMGPQCAGKPRDPNNPPPGYRPWTCPGPGFQNLYCPTYSCNNNTFRCEQNARGVPGPTLGQCMADCSPPTYVCNRSDSKCYLTVPGFGQSLPLCQKDCTAAKYVCNKNNYQCEVNPNGGDFNTCSKECVPPTYECDASYNCVKTVPGRGSSLEVCEQMCSNVPAPASAPSSPQEAEYICDQATFTCSPSKNSSGIPQSLCIETCGKPSNVTPTELLGDYRGVMVNQGYVKGEWTAQIQDSQFYIKDPKGAIWIKGTIATYNSELWLATNKGTFRTIYSMVQLPEVIQLSWAFGPVGGASAPTWESGMSNGPTFEFSKCLSTVGLCKWNLNMGVRKMLAKEQDVIDPCSKYPTCRQCIAALDYCGWCSLPVLYNGTIQGTNCGGLNKTKVPGLVCPGTFSTVNCPNVPVPIPVPVPVTVPQPPVPSEPLFVCDVGSGKCRSMNPKNESGGMPIAFCNLVCNVIPYVPPILVGRVWRGIQIRLGYTPGEWTAVFSTDSVTVTDPKGAKMIGKVGTTSQFLYIDMPNGNRIYSLWQLESTPPVDILSWALGAEKGLPPKSYNEAMVTEGQNQFVFAACPIDHEMPCSFSP